MVQAMGDVHSGPATAGLATISDEDFETFFYDVDLQDSMARCAASRASMLAAKAIAQIVWVPPSQKLLRRWLAIRPCAPEKSFISDLLVWMLTQAADRAAMTDARDVALRVVALHQAGQTDHHSGELRSARRAAMIVADLETSNNQDKAVAELSAAAAWPPAEASTVLADSILQWATLVAGQVLRDAGFEPLDHAAVQKRLDGLYGAAQTSGMPADEIDVFKLLDAQFPEEAKALRDYNGAERLARESAMTAFVEEAERIAGRPWPEPH